MDSASTNNIEETLQRLEIVQVLQPEEQPLEEQAPEYEEKDLAIFCVKDALQFFNSKDVLCSYQRGYIRPHKYERAMLSFKQCEFVHVISSTLQSVNTNCISDVKSFIDFLLRTLSVHQDVACINACYHALLTLLDEHPFSETLTFSCAEIFMLLFNYGK